MATRKLKVRYMADRIFLFDSTVLEENLGIGKGCLGEAQKPKTIKE